MLTALVRMSCGRRTKWFVVAFWLILASASAPIAGRLSEASRNSSIDFLPRSAESTQVLESQLRTQPGGMLPVLVVYERPTGLLAADHAKVAWDARQLTEFSDNGQVSPPVPSRDGRALHFAVSLRSTGDSGLADTVQRIRAIVHDDLAAGLSAHVTGPAAIQADTFTAFRGVDDKLLATTSLVVVVILLITYRSPFLWLVPLAVAGVSLEVTQAANYLLAQSAGLTVTPQTLGILLVLVFGASTDYALLIIARYREELRRHTDKHTAMRVALHRAAPAIVASTATVVVALLCLLTADLNFTRALGPVSTVGLVCGLAATTTLLPAVLVILPLGVFWPFIPEYGRPVANSVGLWARIGRVVAARPRAWWIGTALVLAAAALGLTRLDASGLPGTEVYRDPADSVSGEQVLARHFDAGTGAPAIVIGNAAAAPRLREAAMATPGVATVGPPEPRGVHVELKVTLSSSRDDRAAQDTVERLRTTVHGVADAAARVGGPSAILLDIRQAAQRDRQVVIPLVLVVVLVIVAALLRAVVASVLVTATVVLSFAATVGMSALAFEYVFGYSGTDPTFPLYVFVFLVALAIDYNIFLMSRVREESTQAGTRVGTLTGLSVTGGVITSAGVVLAGTFAMLVVLPFIPLVQVGMTVALGVLLDTLIVRSVLVPALILDLGSWTWWPSSLRRGS